MRQRVSLRARARARRRVRRRLARAAGAPLSALRALRQRWRRLCGAAGMGAFDVSPHSHGYRRMHNATAAAAADRAREALHKSVRQSAKARSCVGLQVVLSIGKKARVGHCVWLP